MQPRKPEKSLMYMGTERHSHGKGWSETLTQGYIPTTLTWSPTPELINRGVLALQIA